MIKIEKLHADDVGKWVTYRSSGGDKVEHGRIKSWNTGVIFVVYHVDEDWDKYQDFTGAATNPEDLEWYGERDTTWRGM